MMPDRPIDAQHPGRAQGAGPQPCPICGQQMAERFCALILQRHDAPYDQCSRCGFLKVRAPDWYEEAYADAICMADTGIVARNLAIADALARLLPLLGREGRYLDCGGGLGLLVRLMRDRGFDFYWHDHYAPNALARGFEFEPGQARCTAVTAFEVLEHVEDPVEFVSGALALAGSDTLIFTTELFAGEMPPPDWWYYAREEGQHISFYNRSALEALAERLGMRLLSNGWLHMLTAKPIRSWAFAMALSRPSRRLGRLLGRRRPSLVQQDHAAMVARRRAADGAG